MPMTTWLQTSSRRAFARSGNLRCYTSGVSCLRACHTLRFLRAPRDILRRKLSLHFFLALNYLNPTLWTCTTRLHCVQSNWNELLSTVWFSCNPMALGSRVRTAPTFCSHNTIQATGEKSTRFLRVRPVMWIGVTRYSCSKNKYVARARPSSAEYVERANERRGRSHYSLPRSTWRHSAPFPAAPRLPVGPPAQPWHRKSNHRRQNVARR